jgi:hypothetical protein
MKGLPNPEGLRFNMSQKIQINGINCYMNGVNQLSVGGHNWNITSVNPMELSKPLEACSTEEMENKVDELKFSLHPYDGGMLIQTKDGRHQCKYSTTQCDNCDESVYIPIALLRQHIKGHAFFACVECTTTKRSMALGVVSKKVNNLTITKVKDAIAKEYHKFDKVLYNFGWEDNYQGNGLKRTPRILRKIIEAYSIGITPTGLFLGLIEHYIDTGEDLLAELYVDITAEMYTRTSMQVALQDDSEESLYLMQRLAALEE